MLVCALPRTDGCTLWRAAAPERASSPGELLSSLINASFHSPHRAAAYSSAISYCPLQDYGWTQYTCDAATAFLGGVRASCGKTLAFRPWRLVRGHNFLCCGAGCGDRTGERGRGVGGPLDEGGETQERRARRGRGRSAVGLGGSRRGRVAESAGPVPVSGRRAHQDAAGAGHWTLEINTLGVDGPIVVELRTRLMVIRAIFGRANTPRQNALGARGVRALHF